MLASISRSSKSYRPAAHSELCRATLQSATVLRPSSHHTVQIRGQYSSSSGNSSSEASSSKKPIQLTASTPPPSNENQAKVGSWSLRRSLHKLSLRLFPYTQTVDAPQKKEKSPRENWKHPSRPSSDLTRLRHRAERRWDKIALKNAELTAVSRSREKLRMMSKKSRAEINLERLQERDKNLDKKRHKPETQEHQSDYQYIDSSDFISREVEDNAKIDGQEHQEPTGVTIGSSSMRSQSPPPERRSFSPPDSSSADPWKTMIASLEATTTEMRDLPPHFKQNQKEEDTPYRRYNRSDGRSELIKGASIRLHRQVIAAEANNIKDSTDTSTYLPFERIPDQSDEKRAWWDEKGKWRWPIGGKLSAKEVSMEEVEPLRPMEVARLAHGLDRVLFNPGVHWLRDVRTGIYNFEPKLRTLYDVDLFDYSALPPYQTSSKDEELAELVRRTSKKYSGSTSSMTALLSHIYFLISAWKQPDLSGFSAGFNTLPKAFSYGAKLPASIILRRFEDQVGDEIRVRYAIDADKGSEGNDNSNYVLMQLGKSVEKLLTSSNEDYEKYLRINSHVLSKEEKEKKEAYHYTSSGKFLMRSQLDCFDDRLPRKSFDLKTRAVIAVRQDRANWAESSGYMIRHGTGVFESFEREMWDMTRAALLKYYFQAKIGNMDGIMVAYHSTATVFGFQYLPCEDMAMKLFSSTVMGDQAFRLSVGMLERILDTITDLKPDHSLKITLDTNHGDDPKMHAFAQALNDEEADYSKGAEEEVDAAPQDVTETLEEQSKVEAEPAIQKDQGSDDEQKDQERQRGKDLIQLDVQVDRYLGDDLVKGPVDFTTPTAYRINEGMEDEITRRKRANLPPLNWSLEYMIKPRMDLTPHQVQENLRNILARKEGLSPLILPNMELLNERERMREQELSKNEAALQKFYEDRKSGLAMGMPPAPGQISLGEREDKVSVGATDGDAQAASADVKEAKAGEARGKQLWKKKTSAVERLRQLARLGKEDKDRDALTDPLEIYERRGN